MMRLGVELVLGLYRADVSCLQDDFLSAYSGSKLIWKKSKGKVAERSKALVCGRLGSNFNLMFCTHVK